MPRAFSQGLWMVAWVIGCAPVWLAWAASAHADQVHLVGGSQLEGKATRQGDKVVIETESGQIALSADSVERIERGQSPVQRYEALEGKLQPGDVKGRLALADFCRDNGMNAREKTLLREVIALDPDEAQARARLGYVKTPAGWITQDEQMRAQGYVRKDGQWVSPERALELDRLRAEADAAARDRERAQAALDAQRAEQVAARQRELDDEADRAALQPTAAPYGYGYSYGYGYLGYGYRYGAHPSHPIARPVPNVPASPTHTAPSSHETHGSSRPSFGMRSTRSY
jgi:hypothetical protein